MPPDPGLNLSSPLPRLRNEIQHGCEERGSGSQGLEAYITDWADRLTAHLEGDLCRRLQRMAAAFDGYADKSVPRRKQLCAKAIRAILLYRRRYTDAAGTPALSVMSPVTQLHGVGPERARRLAQLDITTVGDLLKHYPRGYDDRRNPPAVVDLEHRQDATIKVTVTAEGRLIRRPGLTIAVVPATNADTPIELAWFNQPYRAEQYEADTELVVTGQVRMHKGSYSIAVSNSERIETDSGATDSMTAPIGRIVPMYSLTDGISNSFLRDLIGRAVQECRPLPQGAVPDCIARKRRLPALPDALRQIHFPDDEEKRAAARRRISYDELFVLQATLAVRRRNFAKAPQKDEVTIEWSVSGFVGELPFEPTEAQSRVFEEIDDDLRAKTAAARLIHGDVGSGKTVCAAFALAAAAANDRQAALMAPTELLAQQHHDTISQLLGPFDIDCHLLIGALTESKKRHVRKQIDTGISNIVIGTQALFQQKVSFDNLGVVVIDEQQRFGVRQRARLTDKGLHPNVFLLSATPIPRTLALTAYGDFQVSVIDEMPPGRQPVHTVVASSRQRESALETAAAKVAAGRQAFVVCPIIERDDKGYLTAAENHFHRLSMGPFESFDVGLLHGQMDTAEKDDVMDQFRRGDIDVLVTTTVIEVGVDVPNVTVMIVENAERFGLAQLHQLRGRIGRGIHDSICILLTRSTSEEVIERLQVLQRVNDGFKIAEEDLRRRGPGELTETQQSGLPDLRMADLIADTKTLSIAREDAFAVIDDDPNLSKPENVMLADAMQRLEPDGGEWAL